jgi:hypothetical protein
MAVLQDVNWTTAQQSSSWAVKKAYAGETMRTGGRRLTQMMDEDVVVRKFPEEQDQFNWLISLFNLGPSGPRRAW